MTKRLLLRDSDEGGGTALRVGSREPSGQLCACAEMRRYFRDDDQKHRSHEDEAGLG